MRRERNERVLWEDDRVFVLVDNRAVRPKALMIPKDTMNYLIDASSSLVRRLAEVAAATSDAFIRAAANECGPGVQSQIFVNPPRGLGVQQLHVHVAPPFPFGGGGVQGDFYLRVETYLAATLH